MTLSNPVSRVIAKCWTDPSFKAALLENPRDVLAAEGVEIDAALDVCVHENTTETVHLVIPAGPDKTALSERDIERAVIAGATNVDGNCL